MRYITRPSAVRDGREGLLLVRLDVEHQNYFVLRASLIAWAQTRQAMEHLSPRRGVKRGRTHYRATIGFERDIGTRDALALVGEWLDTALPRASAVAAAHRDTARLHVHLWIDARQTDGRKIDLSARAWRQLDESWNRIYCRALGLDEREHLMKKWSTERAKQLRRQARQVDLPARKGKSYYRHRDTEKTIYTKEEDGREKTTENSALGRAAQVGAGRTERTARYFQPAAERRERVFEKGEQQATDRQSAAPAHRSDLGTGEGQSFRRQPIPHRIEPKYRVPEPAPHRVSRSDRSPLASTEEKRSPVVPQLDTAQKDKEEYER